MQFTRLTKIRPYTDVICLGLHIDSVPYRDSPGTYHEKIKQFHLIHFRSKRGRLYQQCDPITVDADNVIDICTNHVDTGRNTLIITNHSLPLLGSSDFTDQMELGNILLRQGKNEIYKLSDGTTEQIDTVPFVVSCPPTIAMFDSIISGYSYTLVDIANYGIEYMADVYSKLDNNDTKLINSALSDKINPEDSLTCCILIARFMQEYWGIMHVSKLGGIALTYSSQGMRAFRHGFYENTILPHENHTDRILEGNCYLGGRVEERYHGYYKGKTYLVDIQSLYPYLGSTKPFPVELVTSELYPSETTISSWFTQGMVFADCHVDCPVPMLPKPGANGLKWPVGSFRTYLCADELLNAVSLGYVKKIYKANLYKTDYVLKRYSEYMLALRSVYKRNNNKLAEYIVKVITNGTWGKMGQQGHYWQVDTSVIPSEVYGGFYKYNKDTKQNEQYRVINGEVSKMVHTPFIPNTFTPISAAMNSYSRYYLWKRMKRAGLENVLYCCVDGLIVNQTGYDNLRADITENPHAYGMFKLSESGENCTIMGHGIYMIGDKIAYQGMPKHDEKRYKGFWNVSRGSSELQDMQVNMGRKIIRQQSRNTDYIKSVFVQDVEGKFIFPENLDEPILDTLPELIQNSPALIHHPEWLE